MRLAALLALLTSPAFANCPVAADMQAGIVFKLDDGGTELHRATKKDWVQIYAIFSDGEASLLDFYHGIYLKADVPVVNGIPQVGQTEAYATDAQLRVWPKPQAGEAWTNTTPGGGTANATQTKTIRVGNCTYRGFDVNIVFNDDPNYLETYSYLPELGTGLLIATTDENGTERYRYTNMRVNK